MTNSEIECFLAICRYKTVSRAAEALYITQPSLSARLKTLENELGGLLFDRKKGNREMSLTAAGQKFYQLALEYESVSNKMANIFKKESDLIRISSINSIGTYFLPEVYHIFLELYPHNRLEIQDMELEAAAKSILNGATDIAFTVGKTTDERLVLTPLFLEKMVLISGQNMAFENPVSLQQLRKNSDKEIYVEWCPSYIFWHQKELKVNAPTLTVSIMTQLKQFIEKGDCWSIVPLSIAQSLLKDCSAKINEIDFNLPHREVSMITSSDNEKTIIQDFFGCIKKKLRCMPELHSLLI